MEPTLFNVSINALKNGAEYTHETAGDKDLVEAVSKLEGRAAFRDV